MTDNVQQSPLFSPSERVKKPASLFILPKEFPELLRQWQAVFARVFSQQHVDLRPKIQAELLSKRGINRDHRQTRAIVEDGALVFFFAVEGANDTARVFVDELFLDANRDAEMRPPEFVVRAFQNGRKMKLLFGCFL